MLGLLQQMADSTQMFVDFGLRTHLAKLGLRCLVLLLQPRARIDFFLQLDIVSWGTTMSASGKSLQW